MRQTDTGSPIVVVYGDEPHRKNTILTRALDSLLPPEIDRSLALTEYDGSRSEDKGGPSLAHVLEDLATLPFLSDRRVVVVREADSFVTAHRERLERYLEKPSPTGMLVLECLRFPKTTRLYKAAVGCGAQLHECKKLTSRELVGFVAAEASRHQKRIDPPAATRLIDLVGQDAGVLAMEIEKLALYAADRSAIGDQDVCDLVGQSREEKIFAVMDAAAHGRVGDAVHLWHEVLSTDPEAAYKAVGGIAYKVRQWLLAHRMLAEGTDITAIASKMMMWKRESELGTLLRKLSPEVLRRFLAAIAQLDSQAKSGARSIEKGVEVLLIQLATAAG